MPKEPENRRLLDEQDLIRWREGTLLAEHDAEEASDASSASNPLSIPQKSVTNFHKSAIHQAERKQSLLTKALTQPVQTENAKPNLDMTTEMTRQRSARSTTSTASTADLTSDGFTSPTRASTPSPTLPSATYMSFAPYTLGPKLAKAAYPIIDGQLPAAEKPTDTVLKPDPALEAVVKKRTISFAIGGKPKEPVSMRKQSSGTEEEKPIEAPTPKRTIKFACAVPKPEKTAVTVPKVEEPVKKATLAPPPIPKSRDRSTSRSPSMNRKVRVSTQDKKNRDSTGTVRRASQSPAAFRRKPKFIAADNEALKSTEARFHEFASDEPQEDDWIRNDDSHTKAKLTIDDTLKKENAIRRLAEEAEDEEALEDDDDEDEEENDDENDDEDDDDEDEDLDEEDEVSDEEDGVTAGEDEDDNVTIGSYIDSGASDGNETDNELGFAESDDDDDPTGEYAFWTPGKYLFASSGEANNTFRPSVMRKNRRMSDSSIDSLDHMSPVGGKKGEKTGRMKPSRKIKIRPGTPDLPDSTDFVCGTLDEDRPLEEAYKSCMEARQREKHHLIPQDIDPSFPTSDPEAEEDEVDEVEGAEDSDEPLWLHGKFEDSDTSSRHHRRSRKSPKHSPRRLHSPPPARHRSPAPALRHRSPPPLKHRSPPPTTRNRSSPPRRLFGQSPRNNRVLPSATIHSPPASLTQPSNIAAIFEPLGNRPGLTHTKSLPRRPNGFVQQYRLRLETAIMEEDENDGHTRGAIDIVKGLEQKRERRKEKFYKKLCDKARKGQHVQRRPQPGRGAERMKELGLQMAGKTVPGQKTGKAEYVLSV